MIYYRFNDECYWHKQILSSDDEQIRSSVGGVKMKCFKKKLSKQQMSYLQGTTNKMIRIVIQTNNEDAKEIQPNDVVYYNNYKYFVISSEEIVSLVSRDAVEYEIILG